jgi:hypothetical protein
MGQSGGYGFSNVEDSISKQERSVPDAATGAIRLKSLTVADQKDGRAYMQTENCVTQHQSAKSGCGC